MMALLHAEGLEAEGPRGRIFGPLDLELHPGQLCFVHGEQGSGKSSLLLALAGRLRAARGSLTIDGVDAMAEPRKAMARTAVARLGDYVVPEDRLTLRESLFERCFLDGIRVRDGVERAARFEELMGFRLDRAVEMAQLTPLERTVASVALVMLRPTKVVVLDDADVLVPHEQQPLMFELLGRALTLDGATLVAATLDAGTAPAGAVEITLPSQRRSAATPVDEGLAIIETSDAPPFEVDRDVLFDAIRNAAPVVDETPAEPADEQPTNKEDEA